jgi:pimeloyl-ACP methyl ester carboxylesterase
VVAHDTGATVARRLALVDPERARQLVLIDTEIPHQRPPLVPMMQKVLALPGANAVMRAAMGSGWFVRSKYGFGGCFKDSSLIDGEFSEHIVARVARSPRRMEGQIRYALGINWSQLDALAEEHGRIAARVLLVWGTRDPFFPIDQARAMVPQFRACDGLVAIEGAKLFPHEEFPDRVAEHALRFFAS